MLKYLEIYFKELANVILGLVSKESAWQVDMLGTQGRTGAAAQTPKQCDGRLSSSLSDLILCSEGLQLMRSRMPILWRVIYFTQKYIDFNVNPI
jgi:hypothetical protein